MKMFSVDQEDLEVLKIVVQQSPEGVNIEQVRRAIKLLDVLDSIKTSELSLEDIDHQYLIKRFNEMKFVRAERKILELFDRILEAKEININS